MAQGSPKGRAAALAAVCGVVAAVVAGIASVAIQAGTVGGYVLFALLVAIAIGLIVVAGYSIGRARIPDSSES